MQQSAIKLTDLSAAVVLVGSMMSSDEHGLPAGRTVSARLVEEIVRPALKAAPARLGLTPGDLIRIERLALETPFEVLLHDHPEPDFARTQLAALYGGGTSNPLHSALAQSVQAKNVAHVVTTNYDPCIEDAIGRGRIQLVIEERDAAAIDWTPSGAPIVFKIHGCATRDHTMIFRLAEEGALPTWKRQLLAKLLDGRDLAVMGYSGLDFDICPILFQLDYARMFWLFAATKDLDGAIAVASPNVRNVHERAAEFGRVFGVLGGFDAIFDGLVPKPYRFKPSTAPASIGKDLFANEASNPFGYQLWRGRLLQAISCRIGSEAVCAAMNPADAQRPQALQLQSDMLERAGRYKDSIRVMGLLERLYAAQGSHDEMLRCLSIAAGRRYTGYQIRFFRDWLRYERRVRALKASGSTFDEALAEARSTYLKVLALKLVRRLGKPVRRWLGRFLSPGAMERAAKLYYLRGEWQEVRLLQGAAGDLGYSLEVSDPHGATSDADLLLSAVDAFVHGNNVVGQASAYRRLPLMSGKRCEELLEALAAFGHSAEFWKFFRDSVRVISPRKRHLYAGFAFAELSSCQYPFYFKPWFFARLAWRWFSAELWTLTNRR